MWPRDAVAGVAPFTYGRWAARKEEPIRPTTRLLAPALAALALALPTGCETETTAVYGNVFRTCLAGEPCDCTVSGNCVFDCPDGGCTMRCLGAQSNCIFSCDGGGCPIVCAAGTAGNCVASCTDGCALECSNTGNCVLSGCAAGACSAACTNLGTCVCSTSCTGP